MCRGTHSPSLVRMARRARGTASALITTILTIACAVAQRDATVDDSTQAPSAAGAEGGYSAPSRGHAHIAPHGGTLVELGDEFAHVEFVFDTATAILTAFVLDGEAEGGMAIPASALQVALALDDSASAVVLALVGQGSVLTGERADSTSRFAAPAPMLRGVHTVRGVLSRITVKGETFTDIPFTLALPRHPATP